MPARSSITWILGRAVAVLLLSGLAGATFVRLAPGFGTDERALDTRLSAETRAAIAREHAQERDPVRFYGRFFLGLARGDLGRSVVYAQPVSLLIRERTATTISAVVAGLAAGWSAA